MPIERAAVLVAVKTMPAAAPGPVLTATARAGVGINLLQSLRLLVAGGRLGQDYERARGALQLFLDLDPAHRMIVAWIEDYDAHGSPNLTATSATCTEQPAATAGRVNCQFNAADLIRQTRFNYKTYQLQQI